MKHERRITLASRLLNRELSKNRENLNLVLLVGSTARNEDTEYSDLEMVLVGNSPVDTRVFLMEGIVVELISVSSKELAWILSDPSEESWFFWTGLISAARILFGEEEALDNYRQAMSNISHEQYYDAAKKKLVWIHEMQGHVKNAKLRGDLYSAIFHALWLTGVVGEFVAFLNYTHYSKIVSRSLDEARKFLLIPKNYFELMEGIYVERDLSKLVEMATNLHATCFELAASNGISVEDQAIL